MSLADLEPPRVLSLLADAKRWQLMTALAMSDHRVSELTVLLGIPQNLVSYHLNELRSAGLVAMRRSSADRRDVYYRADLSVYQRLLAEAAVSMHPAVALRSDPSSETPPARGRRRVLFLCTGNSARSQMAEAMLAQRSGGRVEARSAGSHPRPLHPLAIAEMSERGFDIAGAESKHFRRFARMRFDRVVTLCDRVREICPEFPGPAPRRHWSIADPSAAADGQAAFRSLADEIDQRVEFLIAELITQQQPKEIA